MFRRKFGTFPQIGEPSQYDALRAIRSQFQACVLQELLTEYGIAQNVVRTAMTAFEHLLINVDENVIHDAPLCDGNVERKDEENNRPGDFSRGSKVALPCEARKSAALWAAENRLAPFENPLHGSSFNSATAERRGKGNHRCDSGLDESTSKPKVALIDYKAGILHSLAVRLLFDGAFGHAEYR